MTNIAYWKSKVMRCLPMSNHRHLLQCMVLPIKYPFSNQVSFILHLALLAIVETQPESPLVYGTSMMAVSNSSYHYKTCWNITYPSPSSTE